MLIISQAIIVFCETDEDVAASLKYVQRWDLDVTIAAGRHSHYGASSTDGGLVIGELLWCYGVTETDSSRSEKDEEARG